MKFKIRGISFKISFFFALSLCIIVSSRRFENLALAFMASMIHETAHLLALVSYGEKPREIRFTIFGIDIHRPENIRILYRQEIVTLLAGPFINLILALILKIFSLLYKSRFFLDASHINLALAIFNLLPISPLDGGRALYFFLCTKMGEDRAKKLGENIGLAFLFPLFIFAFYILAQNKYNYSLLIICTYLCLYLLLDRGEINTKKAYDKLLQSPKILTPKQKNFI